MQTGTKTGVGCYKCGKSGHWSRDCTVPKSQWISGPSIAGRPAGQTNPSQQPPQSDANEKSAADALQKLAPKGKKRVQKPKLTFEVLQRPQDGLPVVFLTFAQRFKKKFKGKGHEGSDLRRLLEMYERWQRNLFPSASFDEFIAGVEAIGRTGEVKRELRELRMGAIRLLEEEDEPEVPPSSVQEDGGPSATAGAPDLAGAAAAEAEPGMLEEDWIQPGAAPHEPQLEDEDYMIDSDLEDELYAMIDDRDQARPQPQVAAPQQAAADGPRSDAGEQQLSPIQAASPLDAVGMLSVRGEQSIEAAGTTGVAGGVSAVEDGTCAATDGGPDASGGVAMEVQDGLSVQAGGKETAGSPQAEGVGVLGQKRAPAPEVGEPAADFGKRSASPRTGSPGVDSEVESAAKKQKVGCEAD